MTKKSKNKQIVVFETDKSKKFSVDDPNNYRSDMQPHIEKDETVDDKYVNSVTKKFNETSKGLVRITQMGKEVNQQNRASNNVHVANFSEIPTLSGHHKDHKTGRKKRAIVNGNTGPVAPLSNLLSDILKPYCNELKDTIGKTVENTEELLSDFVEYNKSSKCDNGGKKFIGSLDVESLYPSLKVSDCVDIVRETIVNSDINIETVDITELSIFLRK